MKFLVVDDEPLVRRSLERALKTKGHEVVTAEDGTMGVQKWRAEKPDLVFLDVLMPGLNGMQVLDEIGSEDSAKVIMISAYSGMDRSGGDDERIDLFLEKPFEDIFQVVEKAEELVNG